MINSFLKKSIFTMLFFCSYTIISQSDIASININTQKGHEINPGFSGFNVRIADKVWSYTHPDFRQTVHELKPGWLRYFSGTMGDAFSAATGQYDLDYAMMFNKKNQYLKGYKFTEVKGPHRIIDLYHLLGEINGKLIVTINAFSETPEMTEALVNFCKNNNIIVETWQFCNEPYFYVPHRDRYWWNDGYDYATKMKPHAEIIKKTFSDANLALNFTWDGIWKFMREINTYQKENGAFWNVFSKHSYAPHIGRKEPLESAYKRGNTMLLKATDKSAMAEIETYTQKNIPIVITEFGVWNKPLNGIYSSIYNIEYVMRQMQHPNTKYVGAHEVSDKYVPLRNYNDSIVNAFNSGIKLNTNNINTGIHRRLEGKAYKIFHEASNNSNFIYQSSISNPLMVPGLNNTEEIGCFTQAYKGFNGYNYLVFTNRSGLSKDFKIHIDGKPINKDIEVEYIKANDLKTQNTSIEQQTYKSGTIHIPAYSINIAKWKSKTTEKPIQPRIYKAQITTSGIQLKWGKISNVKSYRIVYSEHNNSPSKSVNISSDKTEFTFNNLKQGKDYTFNLIALNNYGESTPSNNITLNYSLPKTPQIFKTSRRDNTATIFWHSVKNATGYKLKYINTITKEEQIIDAKNVFGFREEGLEFNTPFQFSVAAYNGLGVGSYSKPHTLTLHKNIPFSPKNVSVIRNKNGNAIVKWVEQDSVYPNTTYNIYRGEKLHNYTKIASGVTSNTFMDTSIKSNKSYFYTVKAETPEGESDFYPNTATLINNDSKYSIEIKTIEEREKDYLVLVTFKNIPVNSDFTYGIKMENISYLTVEEQTIKGQNMSMNSGEFKVFIPKKSLVKKSKYAIKPFINSEGKNYNNNLNNQTIHFK